MNQVNILKDKILSKKMRNSWVHFNSFWFLIRYIIEVWFRDVGHMTKEKLHDTSRNTSCWVCPVDFDGRREMSSLSVKTVVVHNTVKSLMMETDF